jgi:hypothetical protein
VLPPDFILWVLPPELTTHEGQEKLGRGREREEREEKRERERERERSHQLASTLLLSRLSLNSP